MYRYTTRTHLTEDAKNTLLRLVSSTLVRLSQEWEKAFEVFEKSLSEEQRELFDKYYIEDGAHIGEIERERYEQGFKTGFWLAMQLADFSL